MFPVVLYNNMEGNSSNNNPYNLNIGANFDESVILNSVRNRKKVQDLPNCPVCSCTIRPGGLESHFSQELDRLEKCSLSKKRKLSSPANLAIPGSSTSAEFEDMEEISVDVNGCVGSEVFQRVHSNRLRRLRSRSRRPTSPAQHGECPVCTAPVPMSKLQRHTLRCLKRSGADVEDVPDSSEDDASIDVENDEPEEQAGGSFGAEYTWCGEERVRAAALVSPALRMSTTARADCDVALVVDKDEDTELYGPPQYSPSRIAPSSESAETTEPPSSSDTGQSEPIAEVSITPDEASAPKNEEVSRKSCNGLVEASAETRIKALKEKIKELEASQNGGMECKCLICMGPYSSPAVSIQCWHVYCEVCWLDSLRAKKICPQCNAITNVHHLRRIYM